MRTSPVLALSVFLLVSALPAAEELDREDQLSIVELMDSPYPTERTQGCRSAGAINDKAVLAEFEYVRRLLEVAKSDPLPAVRTEALKALVSLAESRMLEPTQMLEYLLGIIDDEDDDLLVRIDALKLLGRFGKIDPGDLLRIEDVLKKIHKRVTQIAGDATHETRNPLALRVVAIEVLGQLAPEGAHRTLIEVLNKERNSNVLVSAALRGLRNFVEQSAVKDDVLLTDIVRLAAKADPKKEAHIRVAGLQCINSLLRHGTKVPRSKRRGLLEFLFETFTKGSDDELIASSRCLLRLGDEDELEAIVNAHKEKLTSNPSPKTRPVLYKGFIALYYPLAKVAADARTGRSTKAKALASANDITKFLAQVLALPNATEEAQRITIEGLKIIPNEFDRDEAVKALIIALKGAVDRGDTAQATLLEQTLLDITRVPTPFRTGEEEETPDPEGWRKWFGKNLRYLKAGDHPVRHMGDDE